MKTVYRSEAASNELSTREKRAAGSDQVKNEVISGDDYNNYDGNCNLILKFSIYVVVKF